MLSTYVHQECLQVPLHEIPGLLRKCWTSVGAELPVLSVETIHSRDAPSLTSGCTHLSHTPRSLEFWRAAVAKGGLLQPAWEEAQLLIATGAGAKAADAPLEELSLFAEQLLEHGVTEDQPITVWVMETIHNKYADSAELSAHAYTSKQLATGLKTLAWAGLLSKEVVAALARSLCCAVLQGDKEPALPPSHLVDMILQIADAGAPNPVGLQAIPMMTLRLFGDYLHRVFAM